MKTDYDKLIAKFVDTKFESTKGMTFEEGGKKWTGVKQSKADIVFYLL
jgi:hypothetical protein